MPEDGAVKDDQSNKSEDELPPAIGFDWGKYAISFFARNFYNFKMAALVMAFAINFLLLFYRVSW